MIRAVSKKEVTSPLCSHKTHKYSQNKKQQRKRQKDKENKEKQTNKEYITQRSFKKERKKAAR